MARRGSRVLRRAFLIGAGVWCWASGRGIPGSVSGSSLPGATHGGAVGVWWRRWSGSIGTVRRWSWRSRWNHGLASRWQIVWKASRFAMRRQMRTLRPSYRELSCWARLRVGTAPNRSWCGYTSTTSSTTWATGALYDEAHDELTRRDAAVRARHDPSESVEDYGARGPRRARPICETARGSATPARAGLRRLRPGVRRATSWPRGRRAVPGPAGARPGDYRTAAGSNDLGVATTWSTGPAVADLGARPAATPRCPAPASR